METKKTTAAAQDYPGVAIDIDDHNKVTKKRVECDVKKLNNNPRSTDDQMP